MKKFIAIAAAALFFAGATQAQDSTRHHRDFARKGDHGFMKELNLNANQEAQLKSLREANKSKIVAIRNSNSLTAEQKKSQLETIRQSQHEKMQSILTSDQKAKMAEFRKSHTQGDRRDNQAFNRNRKGNFNRDSLRRNFSPEQKAKMDDFRKNHSRADNDKTTQSFNRRGGNFKRGPQIDKMKEQLGLTEAQVNQLKEGQKELSGKMHAIRNNKSLTEEQKKEQFKALSETRKENLESVLTTEQKAKMAEFRKNRGNRTK
ncbi:MAG: motif family protein [Chitinophagaceae bacterium]|nr:motif family protein [Chitinophagaceae bacterium]